MNIRQLSDVEKIILVYGSLHNVLQEFGRKNSIGKDYVHADITSIDELQDGLSRIQELVEALKPLGVVKY